MSELKYKLEIKKYPLEQKYLYLPAICRKNSNTESGNIYYKIKYIDKKGLLEELALIDNQIDNGKHKLIQIKKNSIKTMINHNRDIPYVWQNKNDFNNILTSIVSNNKYLNKLVSNAHYNIFKNEYNNYLRKRKFDSFCKIPKINKSNSIKHISIIHKQNNENNTVKKESEKEADTFLLTGLNSHDLKVIKSNSMPNIRKKV